MDARTVNISAVGGSGGNCSSSSSSSGYGSATTTPTTPLSSNYESQSTTPIATVEPTTIPIATVAAMTSSCVGNLPSTAMSPYYNEPITTVSPAQPLTELGTEMHHRQQFHQTHTLPYSTSTHHQASPMQQSYMYDAYSSSGNLQSQQQYINNFDSNFLRQAEKYSTSSKMYAQASQQHFAVMNAKHIHGNSSGSGSGNNNNTGNNVYKHGDAVNAPSVPTTKPQAAATAFYAQPLGGSYLDSYRYKIPSKLPMGGVAGSIGMSNDYHLNYNKQLANTAAPPYQQQKQFYASSKSQLGPDGLGYVATMKPLPQPTSARQHTNVYYDSANNGYYYDKYDKYLYASPSLQSAGNSTTYSAIPPYALPPAPTTNYPVPQYAIDGTPADAYCKIPTPSASSADWAWNMDYSSSNYRSLPPPPPSLPTNARLPTAAVPPTNTAYLPQSHPTTTRDTFNANEKHAKYDKCNPYYSQQYMPTYQSGMHHLTHSALAHPNLGHLSPTSVPANGPTRRQDCCSQPYQQQQQIHHHQQQHQQLHQQQQQSYYGTQQAPASSLSPPYPSQAQLAMQQPQLQGHFAPSSGSGSVKYNNTMTEFHSHSNKLKHGPNDLQMGAVHPSYNNPVAASYVPIHSDPKNTFYNDLNLPPAATYENYSTSNYQLQMQTQPKQIPPQHHQLHLQLSRNHQVQSYYPGLQHGKPTILDCRKPIIHQTNSLQTECSMSPLPLTNLEEQVVNVNGFTNFDITANVNVQQSELYCNESDAVNADKLNAAKNLSLRDFLSTWNEDEEEYNVTEELNFITDTDQQQLVEHTALLQSDASHIDPPSQTTCETVQRGLVLPVHNNNIASLHQSNEVLQQHQERQEQSNQQMEGVIDYTSAEQDIFDETSKIHVGITVDNNIGTEAIQYINLPDIVIDTEKANNIPTTPVASSVKNRKSSNVGNDEDESQSKRVKFSNDMPYPVLENQIGIVKSVPLDTSTVGSVCEEFSSVEPTENLLIRSCPSASVQAEIETSKSVPLPLRSSVNDNLSSTQTTAFEKEYKTFIDKLNTTEDVKCKLKQDTTKVTNNIVSASTHSTSPLDYSKFHKRNRIQSNHNENTLAEPQSTTSRINEEMQKNVERVKSNKIHKSPGLSKKILNLRRHWPFKNPNKRRMNVPQAHINSLRERHLPLIKRQSLKYFDKVVTFNPQTLFSLSVDTLNTKQFRSHFLLDISRNERRLNELAAGKENVHAITNEIESDPIEDIKVNDSIGPKHQTIPEEIITSPEPKISTNDNIECSEENKDTEIDREEIREEGAIPLIDQVVGNEKHDLTEDSSPTSSSSSSDDESDDDSSTSSVASPEPTTNMQSVIVIRSNSPILSAETQIDAHAIDVQSSASESDSDDDTDSSTNSKDNENGIEQMKNNFDETYKLSERCSPSELEGFQSEKDVMLTPEPIPNDSEFMKTKTVVDQVEPISSETILVKKRLSISDGENSQVIDSGIAIVAIEEDTSKQTRPLAIKTLSGPVLTPDTTDADSNMSDESELNELEAIKRELNQPQPAVQNTDDVLIVDSNKQSCPNGAPIRDATITNSDIAHLKKILECDQQETETETENETEMEAEAEGVLDNDAAPRVQSILITNDIEQTIPLANDIDVGLCTATTTNIITKAILPKTQKDCAIVDVIDEKVSYALERKHSEQSPIAATQDIDENEQNVDRVDCFGRQQNIISNVASLSDLCKIALNSYCSNASTEPTIMMSSSNHQSSSSCSKQSDTIRCNLQNSNVGDDQNNIATTQMNSDDNDDEHHNDNNEREMSVEEALAEMYRQVGVTSDPEDNVDSDGKEEAQQDVLLINLEEILENDSDLYVLHCDMNENILRVVSHTDSNDANDNGNDDDDNDDNNNIDNENVNTIQLVEILNSDNFSNDNDDIQEITNYELLKANVDDDDVNNDDDISVSLSSSPLLLETATSILTTTTSTEVSTTTTSNNVTIDMNVNAEENSASQFDLPSLHHEEIVPDNYKNYENEKFLKYLHEKYVQTNISRFHHSNRILKKYKRYFNSKNKMK